jgi:hypothetical protein
MFKKIFSETHKSLRDIFLFTSYSHKIPNSILFNILPYQNLRIRIDTFLTNKFKKKFSSKNYEKISSYEKAKTEGIFLNQNFFSEKEISYIKDICKDLIENHEDHNLSIDDGGNLEKNSNSFSEYYYLPNYKSKLTQKLKDLYDALYVNQFLIDQLSFLAGIKFKKDEISVHISKVKGKLLSDDWHSDCFCHTAKGFLYLGDVNRKNSPFCFLKNSHSNTNLKMLIESENSNSILAENKDNIQKKSGDDIWNKLKHSNYAKKVFSESSTVECTFQKGTLITCDTSGFHKKGFSDGSEERLMIGFAGNRGTMYQKFKSTFFNNEI